MVHALLRWDNHGGDDIILCYSSVKHATWIYNLVLNRQYGLTPLEFITKDKTNHRDLLRLHVWVCQDYVIDDKFSK